jgi:hypothetical protein
MTRSVYNNGDNNNGTYTPPRNQDINVYLNQLDTILKSFKMAGRKELTVSRLDTLNKLLAAVILKIPAAP